MSLITRMRRQDAIYWPPLNRADRFGQTRFGEPVAVRCRWESGVSQTEEVNGTFITVTHLAYVDREMEVGGKLYLGAFNDTPNVAVPHPDAREIVKFEMLPNLRNTATLYTAMM